MAIPRFANYDEGLGNISRYSSTIEEDSRRREQAEKKLDAERDERASLMRHLTKTRDLMAELLNILDSIPDEETGVLMMKKTRQPGKKVLNQQRQCASWHL